MWPDEYLRLGRTSTTEPISPERPIIGITTQTLHAIDGIPAALPQSWVMNQRYFLAATIVGGVPWIIPLLDDDPETLRAIYDRLDGILIPGGVDMDPATFGEERRPALGAIDPARDRVELQLTRWAIEDRKPVLGLCRGVQVINVALGGTLYQDLEPELPARHQARLLPTAGLRPRPPRARSRATPGLGCGGHGARPRSGEQHASPGYQEAWRRSWSPRPTASGWPVEAVEANTGTSWSACSGIPEVFEMPIQHTRHLFREFIAAAGGVGLSAEELSAED